MYDSIFYEITVLAIQETYSGIPIVISTKDKFHINRV